MVKQGTAWTLVVALASVGLSAQQQQPTAPPAPQVPAAAPPQQADPYVVGRAMPPSDPASPLLDLTLDQAMAIALEKNLDLKVARMSPLGVDYQLAQARAAFNPQFTALYRYNNAAQPTNDSVDVVSSFTTRGQNYNMGVTQTTPWFGGRYQVSFNNNRSTSTNPRQIINPGYGSTVAATYTQPLLAGFKMDATRNQLRTLAITRQVADLTLITSVENTKASVRTAYWSLRQAIESIEIQRRALELARRLFEDNRIRVEIGTLAQIDTVQPETAVANAEQLLLAAEITWRTAQLTLKRLLASSPTDPITLATLNPTEQPMLSLTSVDIQGAVQRALNDRTDVVSSLKNIESSRLTLEVTENQTKPVLDLQGGYSVTGQNRSDSGYGGAITQALGLDLPTWNFQFNFTYPLFMAAARANYARQVLVLEQDRARLDATRLTVAAEVTNAGLAVENSYKQYQAALKAREAAERNAVAEQSRFDFGMSTNYNVVQAQNNLTLQRLAELRQIIQYLNAIAEFDRIQRVGR